VPVSNLVSKIAAGGLSAGVFLLWWPQHVHGDGVENLIVRGLLWTLLAELLIVAFSPLENRAAAAARRWTAPAVAHVRGRIAAVPGRARTGGAVVMACAGLAAPIALLAGAGRPVKPAAAKTRVVERVIVQKPVVRERVVVKRVWAPAATPAPVTVAAPVRPTVSPAARPVARTRSRARTSEPSSTAAPEPAAQKPAASTSPASSGTTTTPESAAPPAAADGAATTGS
jgi:hypothetical protein